MGIRGLTRVVRGYGSNTTLSGDNVVIDGPALVHRLLSGCLSRRREQGSFLSRPSYTLLGRLLIAWLDSLSKAHVKVRKIYFDGYLPPGKWQTRRERLQKHTQQMNQAILPYSCGVSQPAENAFTHLEPVSLVKYAPAGLEQAANRPPFFIPAALEMLKAHERWGPLVQVVPGEADTYCAEDVRRNGGTVLTSDSDLLIQDLGSNGAVSFFDDIDIVIEPSGALTSFTVKFTLSELNSKLGLQEPYGLPLVAFYQKTEQIAFVDALQMVKALQMGKTKASPVLESPGYVEFLREHQDVEYIPADHSALVVCSSLDPRISELVVQFLTHTIDDGTSHHADTRGPGMLSMFLPVMVQNLGQTSCWNMSTTTRQIAYGILQLCSEPQGGQLVEYRTIDAHAQHFGRQIDILGAEETLQACIHLKNQLSTMTTQFGSSELQWFAMAAVCDVEWCSAENRQPLSAAVMGELIYPTAKRNLEDYSWNLINWTAQVQAYYYSLRMVKQALKVASHLRPSLAAPVKQLLRALKSLPQIAEWPIEKQIANQTSKLGVQGLRNITEMLGVAEIKLPTPSPPNPTPRRKAVWKIGSQLQKEGSGSSNKKRTPGLNAFAILSRESE